MTVIDMYIQKGANLKSPTAGLDFVLGQKEYVYTVGVVLLWQEYKQCDGYYVL